VDPPGFFDQPYTSFIAPHEEQTLRQGFPTVKPETAALVDINRIWRGLIEKVEAARYTAETSQWVNESTRS
jgi:hypothetical protein